MLISCKCLNFIASSNSEHLNQQHHQQQHQQYHQQQQLHLQKSASAANAAVETADSTNHNDGNVSPSAIASQTAGNSLVSTLMNVFLQKYPRNFIFYSQIMDFFKQSIGPIPDLTINAINQRDLIYSITIDIPVGQSLQTWQLSVCINCNVALCAKKLQIVSTTPTTPLPPQFLINNALITSNDEVAHRRADKSFSDAFGVRIMDHPEVSGSNASGGTSAATTAPALFTIGSLSTATTAMPVDAKQQRLRQLHGNLQCRLKREIAETNERIQRYTEQQFAMLKSFREKSEQEYDLLRRLIQRVPEQGSSNGGEMLDRLPPMLEVSVGVGASAVNVLGTRRRNTIGSRRDLNNITAPSTPTTPHPQPPNFLAFSTNVATGGGNSFANAMEINQNMRTPAMHMAAATTMLTSAAAKAATATAVAASAAPTVLTGALNRKMSNFDTPPATPEATPMSVGNSPTFKQQQQPAQQQQSAQQQQPVQPTFGLRLSHSFQQQFPTPTVETADDCLFELEGIDGGPTNTNTNFIQSYANNTNPSNLYQQLQHQHQLSYQRQQNLHLHLESNYNLSDFDDSDAAEEAEYAFFDHSMPIPNRPIMLPSGMPGTASLPVEIANSPMASRSYINDTDDEGVLDNTVDIAASIKALAKSVHGEAVFGDLPRPRLRSEI